MAKHRSRTTPGRPQPFVVPIGVPARGSLEFLARVTPPKPDAPFRLELPGDVVSVADDYVLNIIPMVKIQIAGDTPRTRRYAVASFAEESVQETDTVLTAFVERLEGKHPRQFSLSVESGALTFAELIRAFEQDQLGRRSPRTVQMRMKVWLQRSTRPVISEPFPARMVLRGEKTSETPGGEGDSHFLFACHSHWHATCPFPPLKRYTYCHGPCAGSTKCLCDGTNDTCRGWCLCTCV